MADGAHSMAERHYSAAELAGVPGMPGDVTNVRRKADREIWPFRKRAGRGGGREYPESALPPDTQAELKRRAAIAAAARAARTNSVIAQVQIASKVEEEARWRQVQRGMARYAGFTGAKKTRADARADLVHMLRSYASARDMTLNAAAPLFADDYAAGVIEVPAEIRQVIGETTSSVSLMRWHRKLRQQGPAVLAGNYGNRAGSGTIDSHQELHDLIVGMIAAQPHLGAGHIHRSINARFGGTATPVPPMRTLQRWLTRWKRENAQLFCAIRNPDEWKNKYKVAFGSMSEGIERLNQRWELDSTPADVMLTDGRHVIVQVCDVWSRRRLFHVSKSSSAEALCQALRRALLAWGVPELVKIDNGQDYVSHRFQRVLHDLDVQVDTSAPFSPWEKPFVERGFRTFLHDLFEMLPGFSGHNVAEAQAIRAKQAFAERLFKKNAVVEVTMDAAALQSFCDRWTSSIYETEPREALAGMTVQEKVASYTGAIRRVEDERMLDVLLAEAPDGHGLRVVGKKGLRIDGLLYAAADLVALVGEPVHVRYTEDVGRVVVYHDDEFVCVAECPEALGISRQELALESKARQTADTQAARREVKALARKARTNELLAEILDRSAADASKVTVLPTAATPHETAGTASARDASDALATRPLDIRDPKTAALPVTRENEEDVIRARNHRDFTRALEVLYTAPELRNDIDVQWLKDFSRRPAFRSSWMLFDGFDISLQALDPKYADLQTGGQLSGRIAEFM